MTSYCSLLYLAVFLPAVVLVHRILPQRLRWAALLAASYAFFWSVSGKLLVFLLVSTEMCIRDRCTGGKAARADSRRARAGHRPLCAAQKRLDRAADLNLSLIHI